MTDKGLILPSHIINVLDLFDVDFEVNGETILLITRDSVFDLPNKSWRIPAATIDDFVDNLHTTFVQYVAINGDKLALETDSYKLRKFADERATMYTLAKMIKNEHNKMGDVS